MSTTQLNTACVSGAKEKAAQEAVRRAQVYAFLSSVYIYPRENWSEDLPLLPEIVADIAFAPAFPAITVQSLPNLQLGYLHAFGAAGSLCYETEYGLPHEFRQSQELADISGFYNAFGFANGGAVRERPDHVAVELEFMQALTLKEAHALLNGAQEHAEMCSDAQAKFLAEHLGAWIGLFTQSLELNIQDGPFFVLAHYTSDFVHSDAARLGVKLVQRSRKEVTHTPFDPDFSCAACPVVDLIR